MMENAKGPFQMILLVIIAGALTVFALTVITTILRGTRRHGDRPSETTET